jgi:hypothetical protein
LCLQQAYTIAGRRHPPDAAPGAKEHIMAKGQKRSNKEAKKPKAEKKPPAPLAPSSVGGVVDRLRK